MFQKYIDSQYRRPRGWVGRWIGRKMAEQHQPENLWTVNLLDIQPSDQVLEIGFGPGFAIQQVGQHLRDGCIRGVDFSATMVSAASRRNAGAIRAGRVQLQQGNAAHLPFSDATFDKAFSIHGIYFWPQPMNVLREIHRVLRGGGRVVLTVLPKDRWNEADPTAPVGTPECIPYTGAELEAMLRQAGFAETRIEVDPNRQHRSNYSVIGVK